MTSVRCIGLGPTARLRGRSAARYSAAGAAVLLTVSVGLLATAGTAQAAATPVPLGTTEPFGVLAGLGITNTGPTTINGDVGSFPNAAMSGSGSVTFNGTNQAGNGVTQIAKDDLIDAYDNAFGQGPVITISADLAGQRLTPGVYFKGDGLAINGPVPLTLDAGWNPNAVFVFKSGSSLVTQPNTQVNLINGATACNVFWQVTSDTTLGVNSTFRGTILTLTDSTMNTGATLEGRLLTRNGEVRLDSNTILRPDCDFDAAGAAAAAAAAAAASGTGGTGGTSGTGGQVTRVPVGSVDAGGGLGALATLFRSVTAR